MAAGHVSENGLLQEVSLCKLTCGRQGNWKQNGGLVKTCYLKLLISMVVLHG